MRSTSAASSPRSGHRAARDYEVVLASVMLTQRRLRAAASHEKPPAEPISGPDSDVLASSPGPTAAAIERLF
jgi:hypothetical protein